MNQPLLTQRSALVLLLGVLVGVGAGVLTAHSATVRPAQAVVLGAAAFAAAVTFFNSIIAQADGREDR